MFRCVIQYLGSSMICAQEMGETDKCMTVSHVSSNSCDCGQGGGSGTEPEEEDKDNADNDDDNEVPKYQINILRILL